MQTKTLIRIHDDKVKDFYSKNSGFELVSFDFYDQDKVRELNLDGMDKEATLNQLKAHQRVLHIDQDVRVARKLLECGYDCAHKIAKLSEAQFIQRHSNDFSPQKAQQIHRQAVNLKQRTALVYANLKSTVASPYFRATRFYNVQQDILDYMRSLPGYTEIFGPHGYTPCEHCRSILSPVAYFVDLLSLIDESITQPDEDGEYREWKLQNRRPDLYDMPLDCEHTDTLVPYLHIVNEVMEKKLNGYEDITEAYKYLATEIHPFNMPYHLPLEEIRAYLKHFAMALVSIYQAFNVEPTQIAKESLELSVEEQEVITTSDSSARYLNKAYGVDTIISGSLGGIDLLEHFLSQTDLTMAELNELIYQNLRYRKEMDTTIPHQFYINRVLSDDSNLELLYGPVLTFDGEDDYVEVKEPFEENTTFTLSVWVNPVDIDGNRPIVGKETLWVNLHIDGNRPIVGKGLGEQLHKPSLFIDDGKLQYRSSDSEAQESFDGSLEDFFESADQWVHIAWVKEADKYKFYRNGKRFGDEKSAPNEFYTNSSVGYGIGNVSKEGTYWKGMIGNVSIWEEALTEDQIKGIMHQRLTGEEEGLLGYWLLNDGTTETVRDLGQNGNHGTLHGEPQWQSSGYLLNLDHNALDRIHRFIRLSKKLQWSLTDLDWVLRSREEINDDAIEKISKIKSLQQELKAPLEVLSTFWDDMKTIGKGHSKNVSEALFDRVFNQPTVFLRTDDSSSPYHPAYEDNPLYTDTVIDWDYTDMTDDNSRIRHRLNSALNTSDQDLDQIVKHLLENHEVGGEDDHISLDVPNLSLLYRYSRLSSRLELRVREFFLLLRLLNQDAIEAVDDVITLVDWNRWIKESGLSVYQLQYVIEKEPNKHIDPGYVNDDIRPSLENLWKASLVWMVTEDAFVDETIDMERSRDIWLHLIDEKIISERGIIQVADLEDIDDGIWDGYTEEEVERIITILTQRHALQKQGTINHTAGFFKVETTLATAGFNFAIKVAPTEEYYIARFLTPFDEPEDEIPTDISELIDALANILYVANLFQLTPNEVNSIHEHPDWYGIDEVDNDFAFELRHIKTIHCFRGLTQSFNDKEDRLLAYFAIVDTDPEDALKELGEITEWDPKQIETLKEELDNEASTVIEIGDLKVCFDRSNTLGVDINYLIDLRELNDLPVDDANWGIYTTRAKAMLHTFHAKYDNDSDWQKVFTPIEERLNEGKRDRLTKALIKKLGANLSEINSPTALYEYLLLDVEMSGCSQISPVKLGLNSLQTYIQRCMMNLELGVTSHITDTLWKWMGQYRLWEANRKVFLYPENYLDPSLRQNPTPLYKDAQNELLQGNITDETVSGVYKNYFDRLAEVANLRIIDSYYTQIENPNAGIKEDTLFLFGVTRTEPPIYYYRTVLVNEENQTTHNWGPWKKVELTINATDITPVYAFNKLFLFWVERTEIPRKEGDQGKEGGEDGTDTMASVKYSFYNTSMNWASPQTLKSDIEVKGSEEEDKEKNYWKKVYALRMPEEPSRGERLLVLFGPFSKQEESESEYYKPKFAYTLTTDLVREYVRVKLMITPEWREDELRLRGQMAGTGLRSLAIFVGSWGENSDDYQNLVDIYNAEEELWISNPGKLKTPRRLIVAAKAGDMAIFAGGLEASGSSNKVNIYDAEKRLWLPELGSLSERLSGFVGVGMGNLAIFAGGIGERSECFDQVDMYDAEEGIWISDLGTLSERRYKLAGTAVGNLAIFVGGRCEVPSRVVDRYDAENGSWIPEMLSGEGQHNMAGTAVRNLAIFAGGSLMGDEYNDVSDRVHIYDAEKRIWISDPGTLSEARTGLGATTVGNLAIFAGGIRRDSGYFERVDIYNAANEKWSHFDGLSEGRYNLVATTVGNLAIFAGGIGSDSIISGSNKVDIFSLISMTGTINNNELTIIKGDNVIRDNYYFDGNVSEENYFGPLSPLQQVSSNASLIPVKNQPGWFIFNNGDEAYLLMPRGKGFRRISDTLKVKYHEGTLEISNKPYCETAFTPPFLFTRLTTSVINRLSQKVFAGGIDHLLKPDSQAIPEPPFSRFDRDIKLAVLQGHNLLDFQGAYGIYFWEVFYHIPSLIANTLNTNQVFEDAKKWHEYIFEPTATPDKALKTGYWPLNGNYQDKIGGNDGIDDGDLKWEKVEDFPEEPASRQVLNFKGEGSVKLTNPDTLNIKGRGFTVEVWIKGTDFSDEEDVDHPILTTDLKPDTEHERLVLSISSSSVSMHIHNTRLIGKTKLDEKTWYRLVWQYDNLKREMSIWIDGQKDNSQTDCDPFQGTKDLYLGRNDSHHFRGYMAEVRIWHGLKEGLEDSDSSRFWQFVPFIRQDLKTLEQILTDADGLREYLNNPFDPEAIAHTRIGAFEKATVMKYIDNLLEWGDSLFTRDTWESITQATLLYLQGRDLLGKRPPVAGLLPPQGNMTPQSGGLQRIPQPVIDLENMIRMGDDNILLTAQSGNFTPFLGDFCVMENETFTNYWDLVDDRLYKIRHCMNIEGVVRQLALFQPPIDPRRIIDAVAGGGDINEALAALNKPVPNYRFSYILDRARQFTSTLIQFGATLLSAVEKKDAEEMALLRTTHEGNILRLLKDVKEQQIKEAEENLEALIKSLDSTKFREKHYLDLINNGLLPHEEESLKLMIAAVAFQTASSALNAGAIAAYLIPNIYGLAMGGMNYGEAVSQGAKISDIVANQLNQYSALTSTMAQNIRREKDWELQQKLAEHDVKQIEVQISGAELRVEMAKMDLDIHEKNIEQGDEMEYLIKGKFTNQDLYLWMVNRIGTVYFQAYNIALEMALATEKAYQYERDTDETAITSGYWDSLKNGLMAGEGLLLDLDKLEKRYMDASTRELEIEKTLSLLQHDPEALLSLRESGQCEFSLTERLFDFDFPGHYRRKIKTISLSIPAVMGPYQNIRATLIQKTSRVLLSPDLDGVRYLLGVEDAEPPEDTVLRSNWRGYQKIAISKGLNDHGLFELNFRDERYLPFEGTGAISNWTLIMPKAANAFDFNKITDVILHLSYTAYDAGEAFKTQVTALEPIRKYAAYRALSLKQTYPSAWHNFINPPQGDEHTMTLTISEDIFPVNLKPDTLEIGEEVGGENKVIVKTVTETEEDIGLKLDGETVGPDGRVKAPTGLEDWTVTSDDENLASLLDIVLILPFRGELEW